MIRDKIERPTTELTLVNDQIRASQNTITYDSKEYVVEIIVNRFNKRQFFIPDYQRAFVWQEKRKCKFIESVLMGLPIPFMFGVQTQEGNVEILDGAQRIQTLHEFVNNDFALKNIERLDLLNNYLFCELPTEQQNKFLDRSLRMVVLPETVPQQVRLDMFERINTGSDILHKSEIRKGAYSGPFYDFVIECAKEVLFIQLCPISVNKLKRMEAEELILRFFAYSEKYLDFKHSVSGFLNDFLKEKNARGFDKELYKSQFDLMLSYTYRNFANGFAKSQGAKTTPRVRFEAISVGVNLALQSNQNLADMDTSFIQSPTFNKHTTTHASNSGPRLRERVEYVRDQLLGA